MLVRLLALKPCAAVVDVQRQTRKKYITEGLMEANGQSEWASEPSNQNHAVNQGCANAGLANEDQTTNNDSLT